MGNGKLYNNHEVACILADAFGDTCACNFNGNDEWLPFHCDFANTCCPEPVGVACWEQYLKHRDKRVVKHELKVPPHGRLIDADALSDYWKDTFYEMLANTLLQIAPTVIPADKDGEA